jgi:hypothetical protein
MYVNDFARARLDNKFVENELYQRSHQQLEKWTELGYWQNELKRLQEKDLVKDKEEIEKEMNHELLTKFIEVKNAGNK